MDPEVARRLAYLEAQRLVQQQQIASQQQQVATLMLRVEAQGRRLDEEADHRAAMNARLQVGAYEGRIDQMIRDMAAYAAAGPTPQAD